MNGAAPLALGDSSGAVGPKSCALPLLMDINDLVQQDEFDDLPPPKNRAAAGKRKRVMIECARYMLKENHNQWTVHLRRLYQFFVVRYRMDESPFVLLKHNLKILAAPALWPALQALETEISSDQNFFRFIKYDVCRRASLAPKDFGRQQPPRWRSIDTVGQNNRREKGNQYRQVLHLLNLVNPFSLPLPKPFSVDFQEVGDRTHLFYNISGPADDDLLPFSLPCHFLNKHLWSQVQGAAELSSDFKEDMRADPPLWQIRQEQQNPPTDSSNPQAVEDDVRALLGEMNPSELLSKKDKDIVRQEAVLEALSLHPERLCDIRTDRKNLTKRVVQVQLFRETLHLAPGDTGVPVWAYGQKPRNGKGCVPTQALVLRGTWSVTTSPNTVLLEKMDVFAVVTRTTVFPTRLFRPEMLDALLENMSPTRQGLELDAYARFREGHEAAEVQLAEFLESVRRSRAIEPPSLASQPSVETLMAQLRSLTTDPSAEPTSSKRRRSTALDPK